MINKKSKVFLCAIASIGFINSIEIIHVNAMSTKNINVVKFSDTNGHWAESQISKFTNLGYIGGYEDGSFKPNNSITRAEFVKILNNTFGLTNSSGKVFSDTQDHWAKKDIDIAITNGICKGKSSTEFKPNDPITREEAALMISNYEKIANNDHYRINQFNDNENVSNWAKDGVEGVIEKGYMHGYTDNTFKPKGNITRAEAVSTLSRVYEDESNSDAKLNQEEANKVMDKINRLNRSISIRDEREIAYAREAYNNLNTEAKSLVNNIDVLESAEASFNKIKNALKLIQSIPGEIYKKSECTDEQVRKEFVEYKKQVEKAEEAYNNLSEDEKKSIGYFDLSILETGKVMVDKLEQVGSDISKGKNLVDRVNALETYSQYQNPEQIKAIIKEIKDLRDLSESLSYVIKLKIPQDTYQKLFEAENAVLVYENQVESNQANQEEANKVIVQINKLSRSISIRDEREISDAREAYNNLNTEAKSLVNNLNVLESAEASFNKIREVLSLIYDLDYKTYPNKTIEEQIVLYKADVKKVRDAYNSLSQDEQKSIGYFDLSILESAEVTVNQLDREAADKKIAENLVTRINDLKTYKQYTELEQKKAIAMEIKDIRDDYEKLTYTAKKIIDKETYKVLEDAECKLVGSGIY